jgi:hypothetical protein
MPYSKTYVLSHIIQASVNITNSQTSFNVFYINSHINISRWFKLPVIPRIFFIQQIRLPLFIQLCVLIWIYLNRKISFGNILLLTKQVFEFSCHIFSCHLIATSLIVTFFLWRYSPNLGLGLPLWNFPFHFGLLDFRYSVELLGRVISSSQGLYTNTENAHTYTNIKHKCPEWDSNPRSRLPSERRQCMP